MRRVLHILATAQLDAMSLARIVIASARALQPDGYQVEAVFLDGEGPLVDRLIEAGVPARSVYWGGARSLSGNWRVWREFRRSAPDIVHQHIGSEYLRAIARAAGVRRIIAHFHDHGYEMEGGSAVPHSSLFADSIVATSHSVGTLVRGHKRVDVIYPAVVPVPEGPRVRVTEGTTIGALSRLEPVKGYIHLVRAMPTILARVPGARLEIAGEGSEATLLEAEISRLGLTHAVKLLGWRDDLDTLFARWDVFVAPSLMEGFGVSILEAAMRGLPIVTSRTGGIPEIVEDGRTGLLLPPADPTALADAVGGLLLDPPRAAVLGEAAQARARATFTPASFDAAIRAVYARL